MSWIIRGLLLVICGVPLLMTAAESDSPVGKWKTFDDETREAKSIVEVYEKSGKVFIDTNVLINTFSFTTYSTS